MCMQKSRREHAAHRHPEPSASFSALVLAKEMTTKHTAVPWDSTKVVDDLVHSMYKRALTASHLRHADLNATTLGKLGQLAVHLPAGSALSHPMSSRYRIS